MLLRVSAARLISGMLRRANISGVPARALIVLAAAACSSGDGRTAGPTEPVGAAGSVSFTYSGAESGSFSVAGQLVPGQSGASGFRIFVPTDLLFVGGVRARNATHGDFFNLMLPNVTGPGAFSLDGRDCAIACPFAFFELDALLQPTSLPSDTDVQKHFVFTAGTVNVTFFNGLRIAGTFAGSASNLSPAGSVLVITVTNGKFDVPITSFENRR
ncbi:hypothetical protein BH23GEM1_BH23GEM1_12230 [soil metagenome]